MLSILRGFTRNQLPFSYFYKTTEQLRLRGLKWPAKELKNVTYWGFGSSALYTTYGGNNKEGELKFNYNKNFSTLLWIVAGACLLRHRKKPGALLAVATLTPKPDICGSVSHGPTPSRAHGSQNRRSVLHDHDYREKSGTAKPMPSKAFAPSSSVSSNKNTFHLSKFNGPIYNAIYDCKVKRLYELPEGNLTKDYELEMIAKVNAISALITDEKANKAAISEAKYKVSHNLIAEKDMDKTKRFIEVSESYVSTIRKLQRDALRYFKL